MNLVNLAILLVVFASVIGLGHPVSGFMSSYLALTGFTTWRVLKIGSDWPETAPIRRRMLRATLLGFAVWLVLFIGVAAAGW